MPLNVIVVLETFVAFVIAITVHGAAHTAVAALLGDSTGVARGRFSLRPGRQLAPIGTIVGLGLSFSTIGLGWGKPLDLDARRLRVGPNLGTILVAIAGPLVNALLGVGGAIALRYMPAHAELMLRYDMLCNSTIGLNLQQCLSPFQPGYLLRIEQFVFIFAITNLAIALLNIIPLYPLDGYHVLFALLPTRQAIPFRNFAPYMELILLVIFFVLPVLLQFAGLPSINPAGLLFTFALNLANSIASLKPLLFLAL